MYTVDETFKIVKLSYSKHFPHNKLFKIIWCEETLIDVRETDDQEKIIRAYHEKNNRRGINETFFHHKRYH